MANWVHNQIITKNEEDFKKLRSLLCDNKTFDVDFEKIAPMHEDLKITSGGYSWEQNKFNFGFELTLKKIKFQDEVLAPYLNKFYNETITRTDFVEVVKNDLKTNKQDVIKSLKDIYGITNIDEVENKEFDKFETSPFETLISGYFNIQRYGEKDWYDWACTNWGTKWNASETYTNDTNIIEFDTAWSCPMAIMDKLAKHIDFTLLYADEDIGSNFNILVAKNGVFYEDTRIENLTYNQKSFLALLIRGNEPIEWYSEDELIEYYDENWKEDLKVAEQIYNEYI